MSIAEGLDAAGFDDYWIDYLGGYAVVRFLDDGNE